MLGYELDLNSCAIRDGFCKSSHIYIYIYIYIYISISMRMHTGSDNLKDTHTTHAHSTIAYM